MCWNQASLLFDHTGMKRPVGGDTYWVSSMICSPSLSCTMRMLTLNTPTSVSYSLPTTRKSAVFSKPNTLAKKLASRSMSPTVKPIVFTRWMPEERSCACPAWNGTSSRRMAATATSSRSARHVGADFHV